MRTTRVDRTRYSRAGHTQRSVVEVMIKTATCILIALATVSCSSMKNALGRAFYRPQYERQMSELTPEEFDMCEAVFRYQFEHNASGHGTNAPAFYIRIFGDNPPKQFLLRFAGHHPPVNPGSRFKIGRGIAFSISSLKLTGPAKAEAGGGYYEGLLSSSGNTYYLEKKDGKWAVTRDVMHYISYTPNQGIDGIACYARKPSF